MKDADQVTRLLAACRSGESQAVDDLLPLIYGELKRVARRHLRAERDDHTLQTTALVHEAWLKLVDHQDREWDNRAHFLSVAAVAMRRILVNYAHARNTLKRGGDREREELSEVAEAFEERAGDILSLDECLTRLCEKDPTKARIVELRFFSGLSIPETARVMNVSDRTVERGWRVAKAWLRSEMGESK